MPLAELTERSAVIKAIEEYDRLGQQAFLDRYGFRRSRGYILRSDGKDYDSKAIAGAAYGYQFPERGPLRSADFVGGENTVQSKLEDLGFQVVGPSEPWSRDEVDRIVIDYFDMLAREGRGESYSKTEHRERLKPSLNGRSDGSIEFKHANISAILIELGLPYIRGYKPRGNVQELLREGVVEFVEGPSAPVMGNVIDSFETVRAPSAPSFDKALVDAPVPAPGADAAVRRPRLPRKYNYAERDERNHALGRAGEAWAVEFERDRLTRGGRPDLAQRVDWLADRLGDGAGYDIVSYDEDGAGRYIEVKTTNGGALTTFLLSANELAASREHGEAYCLYRIFEFSTAPHVFILRGDLSIALDLAPADYRARLRPSVNDDAAE